MSSCSVAFRPARSRACTLNDATKPCSGIGSVVIPAWCGPSNGTNAGCGTGGAAWLGRRTPGQRRARAHRDTGAQRPGDETAAGDPRSWWPLGHCSFRTPATWDRFSDSPASCAFSASTTCGVHGHRRAPRRRVLTVLGAEQHPAVALAQRPHGVEDLGEAGGDLAQQRGIGLLQRPAQLVDGDLRALQVGVEVPQVGLGVAILLAGDLALRHLFDELGRAVGDVDRFDLDASATAPSARRCPCRAGRRTVRRPRWCSSRTAGTPAGASR